MRLLLDTVTFIWAAHSPERLSKKAIAALQKDDVVREFSTISISEIVIKQTQGKLNLSEQALHKGIADLKVRILPYSISHACQLFSLPFHHKDPFDRQIIAQALVEKIPVITSDKKFHLYHGLKVLW